MCADDVRARVVQANFLMRQLGFLGRVVEDTCHGLVCRPACGFADGGLIVEARHNDRLVRKRLCHVTRQIKQVGANHNAVEVVDAPAQRLKQSR